MRTSEKKVNYDVWLHWNVTTRCNMNCQYCFEFNSKNKQSGKIPEINIPALIKTLDKTNKIFRINFVGGEPFLVPNIIEACVEITKKNYISLNTNLTSTKFKEFSEKINPKKVSYIVSSLHIKELEKNSLMDRYIDNFLSCKKKGFNIFAVVIAHPSLLDEAKKYEEFFRRKNINIMFSAFIGKYNDKKYPEAYTTKEIKIFKIKMKNNKKSNQKGTICNAGYNSGIVNPNGDVSRCSNVNKNMGNIYKEIKFDNHLIRCPSELCICPLKDYDKGLFKRALKENNIRD